MYTLSNRYEILHCIFGSPFKKKNSNLVSERTSNHEKNESGISITTIHDTRDFSSREAMKEKMLIKG